MYPSREKCTYQAESVFCNLQATKRHDGTLCNAEKTRLYGSHNRLVGDSMSPDAQELVRRISETSLKDLGLKKKSLDVL